MTGTQSIKTIELIYLKDQNQKYTFKMLLHSSSNDTPGIREFDNYSRFC